MGEVLNYIVLSEWGPKSIIGNSYKSRTLNLEPGTWNLEPGTWNLEL
jgi:hypothetical protein